MIDQNAILVQGIYLAIILSAVPLLSSMFVGLIVSVLQAATQIQENTLSFVPKMVVVLLSLYFASPWLLPKLIDYTQNILQSVAFIQALSI